MSSDSPSKSLASFGAGGSGGWEGCVGVPAPPRAKRPPPQRGSGPDPSRRGGDLAGGQARSASPERATERRGRTQGGCSKRLRGKRAGGAVPRSQPRSACLWPLPGKDRRRSPALLAEERRPSERPRGTRRPSPLALRSRSPDGGSSRRLPGPAGRGGAGRAGRRGRVFLKAHLLALARPRPSSPPFPGEPAAKTCFQNPFLDPRNQRTAKWLHGSRFLCPT